MTFIIAHRGYCKTNEPDNSIPAFQAALNAKADGIEFDIQLSSDGYFVCYHDANLEKIGRTEQLNELKLKELIEIEISRGVTIPSLEDVLGKFGNKILLNIELKPQKNGVEELVQLIHQYNINKTPNKLIVSSFHGEALKKLKSLDPEIPTGLLVNFGRKKLPLVQKYECDALHPFYDKIPNGWTSLPNWLSSRLHKYYTHKCFTEARNLEILVNPYTVNSAQYLQNCFRQKLHGVITDSVDRAYQTKLNSY